MKEMFKSGNQMNTEMNAVINVEMIVISMLESSGWNECWNYTFQWSNGMYVAQSSSQNFPPQGETKVRWANSGMYSARTSQ